MRDHEYVQLITKDDDTYKQSLSECRYLFEERFKTLEVIENAKKEKSSNGKK